MYQQGYLSLVSIMDLSKIILIHGFALTLYRKQLLAYMSKAFTNKTEIPLLRLLINVSVFLNMPSRV